MPEPIQVYLTSGTAIAEHDEDQLVKQKTFELHCEPAPVSVLPNLPVLDELRVIQDGAALRL